MVAGPVSVLAAGHKTGNVYYTKRVPGGQASAAAGPNSNGSIVYAANVDTGATREVVKLPPGRSIASLNADETLLLGTYVDGATSPTPAASQLPDTDPRFGQPDYAAIGADGKPMTFADAKDLRLHNSLMAARVGAPRVLFTVNTTTGELKESSGSTSGSVIRILADRSQPHHVLPRGHVARGGPHLDDPRRRHRAEEDSHPTMNMEIAGHEFFSADGLMIWYDLQTPRGQDFWLAGTGATGKRTWYHLQRNEWSVHYNVSPDGTLFAGDGGDSEMVARAPDGKRISVPARARAGCGRHPKREFRQPDRPRFLPGGAVGEHGKHDYRLEPNVTFPPDMKWVVFRLNMSGPVHVYAVEIAKSGKR